MNMFVKGDIFSEKITSYNAGIDGKIITTVNKLKIEIIDVKGNNFTAKFLFDYDFNKKIYNKNTIGMGIYNRENNTFRILQSLSNESDPNVIRAALIKGINCGKAIYIESLESTNLPRDLDGALLVAFKATLCKKY